MPGDVGGVKGTGNVNTIVIQNKKNKKKQSNLETFARLLNSSNCIAFQ